MKYTIKPKYEIGTKLWYVDDYYGHKVRDYEITEIKVKINSNGVYHIEYKLWNWDYPSNYIEKSVDENKINEDLWGWAYTDIDSAKIQLKKHLLSKDIEEFERCKITSIDELNKYKAKYNTLVRNEKWQLLMTCSICHIKDTVVKDVYGKYRCAKCLDTFTYPNNKQEA